MSLRRCHVQVGKVCYPSKSAAIRSALKASRARGTALRPYFHAPCKSFHLTSQARREVTSNNGGDAA